VAQIVRKRARARETRSKNLLKRAKIRTFELSKNDYKRMKLDVKIAVPTRDGVVDDHFGHCAYYTIFAVEADGSLSSTTLPSPEGCGCKSNIASVLQAEGVRVMLAGNMGAGAKNVLERHGIKVVRGQRGEVEQLVRDYLAGQVHDSGEACDHHDCH
jgi:predicted Fe-Mo cluster-binding NifX family protein